MISSLFRSLVCLLWCHMTILVIAYPHRVTFELEDNDARCFLQDLTPTKYVLIYQVIYGGQFDVDVDMTDLSTDTKIYPTERKSHDEFYFTVTRNATYRVCFGNQFSSFSHKLVYFELRTEAFESLIDELGRGQKSTVLSFFENSIEVLHLYMSRAETMQVELKNRESGDKMVAEQLNMAVMVWSAAVTLVILLTTFGQVTILKNFFSDKHITYSHRIRPVRS